MSTRLILWLGFSLAAIGTLLSMSDWGRMIEEEYGLGMLFRIRGPVSPPPAPLIFAVDEPSARALGFSTDLEKWPRRAYADLLLALAPAEPAAVVFDVYFEPDRDTPSDKPLAGAIAALPRTALVGRVQPQESSSFWSEQWLEPKFSPHASVVAPFLIPEPASPIHRTWLHKEGLPQPVTLPVEALRLYVQALKQELCIEPDPAALCARLPTLSAELGRAERADRPLYLNHYGPPRTIKTYPISAVLRKSQGVPNRLREQVVFIGISPQSAFEQTKRDSFQTPYTDDSRQQSGVEIAATIFANLVDGSYLKAIEPHYELPLLILWGFLTAAIAALRRAWLMLLGALLLAALYVLAARQLFLHTLWPPLILPLLFQSLPALGLGLLLGLQRERREGERIKKELEIYLPIPLVEKIVSAQQATTLPKELFRGVCLATDIARYTTLSEQLRADALHELTNRYFDVIFELIERYGGHVSDTNGDAIMAYWSDNYFEARVRSQACRAGIEILEVVDRFNAEHPETPLPTRIGIHYGELSRGALGAKGYYQNILVGDTANTASRIEGANKHFNTSLLVSAEALASVAEYSSCHLGRFRLEGRTAPVELYTLKPVVTEKADLLAHTLFKQALGSFLSRDWDRASALFAQLLQADPNDGVTLFYLARCQEFRQRPPDEAWDGTINLRKG